MTKKKYTIEAIEDRISKLPHEVQAKTIIARKGSKYYLTPEEIKERVKEAQNKRKGRLPNDND